MKLLRRAVVLVATTVAAVVVPIGPAHAAVTISTSLTMPVGVAVGETGLNGSMTVVNNNTPPQNTENDILTTIKLAPSCAAAPSPPNPCPTPDTGVFAVAPTASGGAGTVCAGVSFSVSAPDASGVVTFTPSSQVALSPPGGAMGTDRCTINFTFSVLKVPNTDVAPGSAGTQTFANARVQATSSITNLMPANHPSVMLTVVRAIPGLTTQASASVPQGGSISDTATVSGVAGIAAPTGTVMFQLFGPNDSGCAGPAVFSSTNAISAGTAQSSSFQANTAGTYRFVATYNGDANYSPRTGTCNDPGENVVVAASTPHKSPADFDGDGDTDISVFRPSSGTWFALGGSPGAIVWGTSGDVPVPGNYDGDSNVDEAVFRPSDTTWYLRTNSPTAIQWGASGDIPVPGDYDGNGTADLAVFRPSTGVWYIRFPSPQAIPWGASGDIPVPGDYDGNGTTDLAVYRPSTNVWYLRTVAPSSPVWGTSGDIPVPGDYDGNGSTDVAVFRPSSGTWFLRTPTPQAIAWGTSGDVPNPGDYDGNGTTDLAVYRPSSSVWYVRTPTPSSPFWGTSGDIPLPLPDAIRRFFF